MKYYLKEAIMATLQAIAEKIKEGRELGLIINIERTKHRGHRIYREIPTADGKTMRLYLTGYWSKPQLYAYLLGLVEGAAQMLQWVDRKRLAAMGLEAGRRENKA